MEEVIKKPSIIEGKACNPFKKFYEKGHNPLCQYIETKCPQTGNIIKKHPESKAYYISDLTDDEIGDYLTKEQKKEIRKQAKEREENKNRNFSEEEHNKREKEKQEQKDKIEILQQRNQILENQARKQENDFNDLSRSFEDYKKLTEERFNTLVNILLTSNDNKSSKSK